MRKCATKWDKLLELIFECCWPFGWPGRGGLGRASWVLNLIALRFEQSLASLDGFAMRNFGPPNGYKSTFAHVSTNADLYLWYVNSAPNVIEACWLRVMETTPGACQSEPFAQHSIQAYGRRETDREMWVNSRLTHKCIWRVENSIGSPLSTGSISCWMAQHIRFVRQCKPLCLHSDTCIAPDGNKRLLALWFGRMLLWL